MPDQPMSRDEAAEVLREALDPEAGWVDYALLRADADEGVAPNAHAWARRFEQALEVARDALAAPSHPTGKQVNAALAALRAGDAFARSGANVGHFLRPDMTPDERAEGLRLMHATEDAVERHQRRLVRSALEAAAAVANDTPEVPRG